jgi:hypothetical protein
MIPSPWESGRTWRRPVAAVALALLAGCATAPAERPPRDVQASRVFEGLSPDAAFERTLAAVRGAGLNVTGASEAGGLITAELGDLRDRGWAECTARRVTDRSSERQRFRRADQLDRRVELTATVRAAPGGGGTEVALDPAFAERQRNSFTNLTFLEDCRSTGALERQILGSI